MDEQTSTNGFSIILNGSTFETVGDMVALGTISLGAFREDFHASLSYWDRGSYLAQWRDGLSRLVKGETRSAVVTSMYAPRFANFIVWWPMYLVGDRVHVQNQILFLAELGEPFAEADPYRFIADRETQNTDGERISEWPVNLSDIEAFLES